MNFIFSTRAKRDKLGAWPDWPSRRPLEANREFKGPIRYALLEVRPETLTRLQIANEAQSATP